MTITGISTSRLTIPLKTPFVTALRRVGTIDSVVVKIETDTEFTGYGEAPATAAVTGETNASVISAIDEYVLPSITGLEIENIEIIMEKLDHCIHKNTSAKAAVDMAVWDLYGQLYKAPLYALWGGYTNKLETDITISLNPADVMVSDSLLAVERGYNILKIKVGGESHEDIKRIVEIGRAVGGGVRLRIDANQGWEPKQAVKIIRALEDKPLNIELVEQPVKAWDIEGLRFVTGNVGVKILADESVFDVMDAVEIIRTRAADMINIKLMKTGGISGAMKICAIAEAYEVECMMGCMLEGRIGVSAAAHLAAAKKIIKYIDLDVPGLCAEDLYLGGPGFDGADIVMSGDYGIGVRPC